MSAAALTQFLLDVTRGHRNEAFAANPEAVLAESSLDASLRAAVLTQEVGELWLAGAHPMALMYFARASGWSNERYYRCVSEAELTLNTVVSIRDKVIDAYNQILRMPI